MLSCDHYFCCLLNFQTFVVTIFSNLWELKSAGKPTCKLEENDDNLEISKVLSPLLISSDVPALPAMQILFILTFTFSIKYTIFKKLSMAIVSRERQISPNTVYKCVWNEMCSDVHLNRIKTFYNHFTPTYFPNTSHHCDGVNLAIAKPTTAIVIEYCECCLFSKGAVYKSFLGLRDLKAE